MRIFTIHDWGSRSQRPRLLALSINLLKISARNRAEKPVATAVIPVKTDKSRAPLRGE